MLGNLKEFISVVQDGLSNNTNLRQTLHEVQKVTNIFKEKQKVQTESTVNYGAGGELLEKYQSQWAELHSNADRNAKAADEVNKLIEELHFTTKKRLQNANDLALSLSHLPNLTASIAQCMDSLKTVQNLLKSVEKEMVEFEDIVDRSKMERWKLDHHYQLTLYKEKKMSSLEDIRCKLSTKNRETHAEQEKRQLAEIQARRENSAAAFRQDVAYYLSSGHLPTGPARSQQLSLEQVQLDEDKADLDHFLNS